MSPINRMENPICPRSLDEVTLADIEVLERIRRLRGE